MTLFPDLTPAPVLAAPPRQQRPYDRVRCPSCKGWGNHVFEGDDSGPACSLGCGTCGGTGRARRDDAQAFRQEG